jgi:hypothetical protein
VVLNSLVELGQADKRPDPKLLYTEEFLN